MVQLSFERYQKAFAAENDGKLENINPTNVFQEQIWYLLNFSTKEELKSGSMVAKFQIECKA